MDFPCDVERKGSKEVERSERELQSRVTQAKYNCLAMMQRRYVVVDICCRNSAIVSGRIGRCLRTDNQTKPLAYLGNTYTMNPLIMPTTNRYTCSHDARNGVRVCNARKVNHINRKEHFIWHYHLLNIELNQYVSFFRPLYCCDAYQMMLKCSNYTLVTIQTNTHTHGSHILLRIYVTEMHVIAAEHRTDIL